MRSRPGRARGGPRRAACGLAVGLLTTVLAATGASAATVSPAGGKPASPSAAASADPLHFGVRLVDIPVDEAHNPRALQYIIDLLPAGSVIRRRIMIMNEESRTAHLSVYAAAAQIAGGMFIGKNGRAGNELTGWISVQHPVVTLGPGQSVMDLVTIRVPPGATEEEHYGVIWAQQSLPVREKANVLINEVARVGVRVYLAVGAGGVLPTRFAITSLAAERTVAGQPLVVAGVHNIGGRAVDLTGKLRLTNGPGGSGAGPFAERQLVTLAPGQSGNVVFALPADLPAGSWTATVTLVSGQTTATARESVSFGAKAASVSWRSAAMLASGGGLLAGLLVIGAVLVVRLRRPRRGSA